MLVAVTVGVDVGGVPVFVAVWVLVPVGVEVKESGLRWKFGGVPVSVATGVSVEVAVAAA